MSLGFKPTATDKRLVKYLAENGPKSRSDIKEVAPATWAAELEALEEHEDLLQYIESVHVNDSRGRKQVFYWLTIHGVILALVLGADKEKLLRWAKELLPEIYGKEKGSEYYDHVKFMADHMI